MTDRTAVAALNQLLEVCRDGEMGFWTAADHVADEGLKWMFKGIAQRRGEFAEDLKQAIRRLGGAVVEGGSVAGSVHRGWMDVKTAFPGLHERSVLEEAVRGEGSALKAYEAAMATKLPPEAQSLVDTQYTDVKDTHARVTALAAEWARRA